jgi:hypothetical protein
MDVSPSILSDEFIPLQEGISSLAPTNPEQFEYRLKTEFSPEVDMGEVAQDCNLDYRPGELSEDYIPPTTFLDPNSRAAEGTHQEAKQPTARPQYTRTSSHAALEKPQRPSRPRVHTQRQSDNAHPSTRCSPRRKRRSHTHPHPPSPDADADPTDLKALRAKQAHSIVERRYRDNLNAKIMQLHHTLCATGSPYISATSPPSANGGGANTPTKVRKSDIMTDAMNYVHHSETAMRQMAHEIARLTDRVRMLEGLVRWEDCVSFKEMGG